jgi:hypothetical protein
MRCLKCIKGLAFACFVLHIFAATGQETASSIHLKGNIRKLYSYTYLAKDIVINKNTIVSYEKEKVLSHIDYIYEKNGILLAENRFNNHDVIDRSSIYTYENDRLVDHTRALAGKYQISRTAYKYDKEGRKIQSLVYDGKDSLENTIVYKYDSLNNLINEKTYNQINWLITEKRYQYDDNGNCILLENLKTGRLVNKPYREIQKFDDRNNLIYKSFAFEDSLNWEYTARYNQIDSLIYEEVKDGKGQIISYSELKYNKYNKRILLKQYKQGAVIPEIETHYKYDKKGDLSTETVYTPNKKDPFLTRTYFYDDRGNWIYRLEKDKITERNILHYRRIIYY